VRRLLLAGALLVGCPPPAPAEPLDVWFYGCEEIAAGCAFADPDELALTLWVRSEQDVQVSLDGRPVQASSRSVDGGTRLRVPVQTGSAELVVTERPSGRRWSLDLVPMPDLRQPQDGDCEPDVHFDGEVEEALRRVHCVWAGLRDAGSEEAALEASRRASAELVQAARSLDRIGWRTRAARVRFQAGFLAWQAGDPQQGLQIADGIEPGQEADRRWSHHQLRASLGLATGDYPLVEQALERAESVVRRVDLPASLAAATANERATYAAELGDLDAAVAAMQELRELHTPQPGCDRSLAVMSDNLAWYELLRRQADLPPGDVEPRALQARAESLYLACDGDPSDLANLRIGQAFEAWAAGDWRRVLQRIDAVPDTVRAELGAWASALRADAWSRLGEHERASPIAERAVALAREARRVDIAVFTHLVQAEIAVARDEPEAAEASLQAAHDLLFSSLAQVPSPTGRSAFVGMHLRIAPRVLTLMMQLQLDDGRANDAMDTFRRARAASLRSLRQGLTVEAMDPETRDRWTRAQERHDALRLELAEEKRGNWSLSGAELERARQAQAELRAQTDRALAEALALLGGEGEHSLRQPAPDEVLVAFVPVDGRWLALLESDGGTRLVEGPSVRAHGPDLARALGEAVAPHLTQADRITVLPWGEVLDLDLHRELATSPEQEVVWSLDLPPAAPPAPRQGLLVVADPEGNLPAARAEADALASAHDVTRLIGPHATLDAVLESLPTQQAFHFAGHGLLDPEQAWRSGLRLADDDRFDVADILALPSTPRVVVLSGCETGRARTDSRVASLGIAQAFLLAGSRVVVATHHPVPDRQAAMVGTRLLQGSRSPDAVVHRFSLLRSQAAGQELRGWRVWVP